LDLDLPSYDLPSYSDDGIGGKGSILSIVRATGEIANDARIVARKHVRSSRSRNPAQQHSAGGSCVAGSSMTAKTLFALPSR
jgi:hypothetical protein